MADIVTTIRRLAKVQAFYRIAVRRCVEDPSSDNFSLGIGLRWLRRRLETEVLALRPRCARAPSVVVVDPPSRVLQFRQAPRPRPPHR